MESLLLLETLSIYKNIMRKRGSFLLLSKKGEVSVTMTEAQYCP